MKNKKNIWIASALLTMFAAVATIYVLLQYRSSVLLVGLFSLLLLGSAFWLFLNISRMMEAKELHKNTVGEDQREKMNYEGMKLQGEELIRLVNSLGKGTYVNSKRTSEHLEELIRQNAELSATIQKTNRDLARALMDDQTKNAKFQVKYNQNDTGKVIAALNDQCSQMNQNLMQCITAIKDLHFDVPAPQTDIHVTESLHALSLELARISSSIQSLQFAMNEIPAPVHTSSAYKEPTHLEIVEDDEPAKVEASKPEAPKANPVETESVVEPVVETVAEPAVEPVVEAVSEPAVEAVAEPVKTSSKTEIINFPISSIDNSDEKKADATGDNVAIDQSAIDALFAGLDLGDTAAEPVAEQVATPAAEPAPEPVAEPAPEPVKVDATEPQSDVSDILAGDPNKQLSADEIAALFASMGSGNSSSDAAAEPAPEPVAEPAPEPVKEETAEPQSDVSDILAGDPNKKLSADEIAALFAALG